MSADYRLSMQGCDEETVIVLNLDEPEIAVLRKFADRINERSLYSCYPTMKIREATPADIATDTEEIKDLQAEKEIQS